jgi:hypothetical protein
VVYRKPTDSHHTDPKYLGGDPKQPTIELDPKLHQEVHKEIDLIAPRWKGKGFYDGLPTEALKAIKDTIDKMYQEKFPQIMDLYRKVRR